MATISGNNNLTFVAPGRAGVTVTGTGVTPTGFHLYGTQSGLINRFKACVALWKWLAQQPASSEGSAGIEIRIPITQ